MAGSGDYIPVEGGTLTFPWGSQGQIIEVVGYKADDAVDVAKCEGPGMNGYSNAATSQPNNIIKLLGTYTSSSEKTIMSFSGLRGSADIQLGAGEKWTGQVLVNSSSFSGKFEAGKAELEIVVDFIHGMTRTPNVS